MLDGCKYMPEAIQCTDWRVSESFCLKCGWNPEVAKKRKEEVEAAFAGKKSKRVHFRIKMS